MKCHHDLSFSFKPLLFIFSKVHDLTAAMEDAASKHATELLAVQAANTPTVTSGNSTAVEGGSAEASAPVAAPAEAAPAAQAAVKVAVVEGAALDGKSPDAAVILVLMQLKDSAQRDGARATAALFAPFDGGIFYSVHLGSLAMTSIPSCVSRI